MTKQETEEILFIKLCKGLVEICDRINRGEPAYLVNDYQPFPQPLHEAFEKLSIKWILRDGKIRHPSILNMVQAARESIEAVDPEFCQWVDFPDEPLIEDMTKPSEECEDYAIEYSLSLEIDNNQSYIPRLMEEIQKNDLPYSTYTEFRRFIAENPFPSELDKALLIDEHPEIERVKDLLEEAYQDVPLQSNDKQLCKKCGGYLDCAAREIEGCCESLEDKVDKAPLPDTVRCLIRPSLIELRLEKKIKEMGLEVELWPELDKADLKVTFPDGKSWAVDAKDWVNATKLARELNEDGIPEIGQCQSFFVVPDYRLKKLQNQAILKSKYQGNIPVISESELIKRIKKELK
ncbi:restriction endonuclease-related protein [Crocosphaera chwakensis]|uniref:REase associating with pPIWI RE domain-containing protein n=1 Tax=Crocosphaera chwakensis CCY0110 TaxID=391612 RepID=A3IM32_9CHRO|nr:hypothetical protein [Crocosphaera chwakensis]EAZ92488.1 hypothetical protein CY0110_02144 [Crocosphaera chwakensis CCY0110]